MIEKKLNPPTVHEPPGYSHITVTSEGRLAHLAGQCPLDLDGTVVGAPGDFDAQTDQVIANCLAVLEAAGATPGDVVRSVIYVVSADSTQLAAVWDRLNESPLAPAFTTASTLLGVTALGFRGQLVEVDLTAAL
ncbi:RidA family protein [Paractinoplanes abujensis]|uniref:Enamine deaminase RidA (YjgF/YER057c/UK114 family) n=1 Tax=Paractinoplanes abujensis TaxID=882441 RepID=A0A7W7CZX7_9ACTN|nr:RidA family protein [Actinoplanes abujensis]MBB4696393.1 enamine deaminase RidA (YjgF/YER057c/UK114 family) [Actinoplanes abujensis]